MRSVLCGDLRVFNAHLHDAMSLLLIVFTSAFSKLFILTLTLNLTTDPNRNLNAIPILRKSARNCGHDYTVGTLDVLQARDACADMGMRPYPGIAPGV